MKTIFKNESTMDVFFHQNLGLTSNLRVLRLRSEDSISLETYPGNSWEQYSEVYWKSGHNFAGDLVPIICLTKRNKKDFVESLQEPILKVDLKWDFKKQEGNAPSNIQGYITGEEWRLNLMINVPILIGGIPKSFVACYKQMILKVETETVAYSDEFPDSRYWNFFHISLEDRRSDAEMRKIGLLKTVEKPAFQA